ncbi:MAG: phosphoribosylformylglycinamidine cyclo-ligase [Cenarchaeum symbiont of Oopsacas minuta]|nr:phosphoribosylformylglycinamidine cyclo-ligase [Cenarchaeum symbiont of Oopsacas minuta]
MTLTYKKTGVDISKIKSIHHSIGRIISSTHNKSVKHGFGHYAGIVKALGKNIAVHTDGVGTKVLIAGMMKKYDTIGIDCIAMNVNDIICTGAAPIAFVDYIAANRNDAKIFSQIATGLAKGAKMSGTPIVGGETAIMPDMFAGKGFMFDLAGTIVGTIKDKPLLGDATRRGDVIIGVNSSGLHSNGYTLARKALLKFSLKDKIHKGSTIGDALLKPTRIYTKPTLEALQKCTLHAIGHITGGSFSKLSRLKNLRYDIESLPKTPP